MSCLVARGQDYDSGFRDFPRELVPDPPSLLERLTRSGVVVNGNEALMSELQQLGMELLSDLTPEQRQNLTELAQQYLADRGIEPRQGTADWEELARQVQERSASDPKLAETIEEFRQQYSQFERERSRRESASPQSSNPPPPLPSGVDQMLESLHRANGGAPGDTSSRSEQPDEESSRAEPGYRWRANPGQLPGDDPFRDRPPVTAPAGEPIDRNSDSEPAVEAEGSSESPNTSSLADGREARPNRVPPAPASDSSSTSANPERLAVRFDRLLMDMAQRSVQSMDAGSRSQLAASVNSLFDQLVRQVDSVVRNHVADRPSTRGFRPRLRFNTPSFSQAWSRLSRGPDVSSGPFGAVTGLMIFIVVFTLAVAGVLYWWWRTTRAASAIYEAKNAAPPPYRYARVMSRGELIRAVDRLLLAKFGTSARWWDVRRAESALESEDSRVVSSGRLEELATAYEQIRYTRHPDEVSAAQLERINETLFELSRGLEGGANG